MGQGYRTDQLLWLIDEIDKYTIYKFFIMNLAHSPVLKALQDPVQVSMETLYGPIATRIAHSGMPKGNGGPQPPLFQNMILKVCPKILCNFSRICIRAFPTFARV